MSAIEPCLTAGPGCHVEGRSSRGAIRAADNSRRDRHCPKCQGQACRDRLAARGADLPPVRYVHVVFTPPARIAATTLRNRAAVKASLRLVQPASGSHDDTRLKRNRAAADISLLVIFFGNCNIDARRFLKHCCADGWTSRAGSI